MKLRLETVDDWIKLVFAIGGIYSFFEILNIIETSKRLVDLPDHMRELDEMHQTNHEVALQQNATAEELLFTGSIDGVPLTDEERQILEGVRDRSAQDVNMDWDKQAQGFWGW